MSAVEVVIRTVSSVVVGRLGAREAVTILATMTPLALAGARDLARRDPEAAGTFASLLGSLDAALAGGDVATGAELGAVREDVARLIDALQPEEP